MIRDYGEDVGSEETRSIESEDLAKDDVSDLFDETEEVRRPKEPGQLENPRDLSANTGSVPQKAEKRRSFWPHVQNSGLQPPGVSPARP